MLRRLVHVAARAVVRFVSLCWRKTRLRRDSAANRGQPRACAYQGSATPGEERSALVGSAFTPSPRVGRVLAHYAGTGSSLAGTVGRWVTGALTSFDRVQGDGDELPREHRVAVVNQIARIAEKSRRRCL